MDTYVMIGICSAAHVQPCVS